MVIRMKAGMRLLTMTLVTYLWWWKSKVIGTPHMSWSLSRSLTAFIGVTQQHL